MRRVVIAGESMSPTLEVGDVALVSPGQRIRRGDVIAFETREAPIVHRAVIVVPWPGPGGALIVHKGDARTAGYGTTRAGAVLGRVIAFERARERHGLSPRSSRPREVVAALAKLLSVAGRRIRRIRRIRR